MISVQELLNQQGARALDAERLKLKTKRQEEQTIENPQMAASLDASVADPTMGDRHSPSASPSQTITTQEGRSQPKRRKPLGRRHLLRRRRLGLLCLALGYGCMAAALQDFSTTPPLLWIVMGGAASFWGVERARQWHSLLPAMVAAIALINVLLPIWVLGLLTIPIVGLFGCVLLMKEQNLETALLSSLFVYSLSAVAASVGALGLGLMGGNAGVLLLKALQILAGFLLLSLFTSLHRRRFYGLKGQRPALRFALKAGLFAGLAGLGCVTSFGLAQVNWSMVIATTSQMFQ